LESELRELRAQIAGDQELEPNTTLGREFTGVLDEYSVALLGTLQQLSVICGRTCRDKMGLEVYGEAEARTDRVSYDKSVQIYRRCGERLSLLFGRL
jgi:hypothetical protein